MNLDEVRPYTKSSTERLQAMVAALRHVDEIGLAGDVVECGVWRGGNIILARKLSPDRICWLFDTFEGMTEPTDLDMNMNGGKASAVYAEKRKAGRKWTGISVDQVRDNLAETGTLDDDRLRFVVGPVERTLFDPKNLPERIAVLRLDTDWHASTKVELEVLYPRLAPGGVLIVDDYGHWQGARKAVDDYFDSRGPVMERIDYTAIRMTKPC